MRPAFIGVDWGTSNVRAWALDAEGRVLAEAASGQGIGVRSPRGFADDLRSLVGDWTDGRVPVLLGGMIGSRQGWREAPYLPCPARVETLAEATVAFDTSFGPGWIVPGLSCRDAAGIADVMRGEEVQLCGLDVADGLVVLPGTHSKWVRLVGGRIVAFRTFMTGELFAVLRTHSILGRLMQPAADADAFDPGAFDLGVRRALDDPALTALLFSVRSEALFERLPATSLVDYLSGLLIGAEIAAGAGREAPVVVGSGVLARRYARALDAAGQGAAAVIDGVSASTRGLTRIARQVLGDALA